ncbi:HEPN domain-containing protein [Leptospira stimsonii]|uniref:ApeA N-terminal domain-containing protein n=1 Tax=Leptospira stimsonii TaxID=2202203 RepID=A0ABY2N4W1_9LEPT|nr:HEPN domain-containing protein [Leptospira stimsonii]TGK24954.1 hypothetical protein EHO98_03135 [Leptospira stimsonii]TGM17174.1 hypothetical protein EHQ90_08145 [Leptospira stimsonii]
MNNKTIKGQCWFIENPERKLSATFDFSDKTHQINLFGINWKRDDLNSMKEIYHILHATNEQGEPITLVNVRVIIGKYSIFDSNDQSSMNLNVNLHCFPEWILLGIHILDKNVEIFKKSNFTSKSIDEWFGHSPLLPEIEEDLSLKVTARKIEIPIVNVSDKFTLEFRPFPNLSLQEYKSISYSLPLIAYSDFREKCSFLKIVSAAETLCKIFSISSFCPIGFNQINLFTEEGKEIKLLRNPLQTVEEEAINYYFIIKYANVSSNFSEWINRFWQLISDKPAFAEIINSLFFISQFPTKEQKFLYILQAIENFHRIVYSSSQYYIEQEKYKKSHLPILQRAVADLSSEIPLSLKDALRGRLKYGNEISLRNRLMQLMHDLPLSLSKWIATDSQKFVSRVVDTRNYYTHRLPEDAIDLVDFEKSPSIDRTLEIFLVMLILLKAGTPEDAIHKSIYSKDHFRNSSLPLG